MLEDKQKFIIHLQKIAEHSSSLISQLENSIKSHENEILTEEKQIVDLRNQLQKDIESSRLKFAEEYKKAGEIYAISEKNLTLNVGGEIMNVSKDILTTQPDSFLGIWFSGKHPVSIDSLGRYFIDRNPYFFSLLLEYLKTGQMPIVHPEQQEMFEKELQFFGIVH